MIAVSTKQLVLFQRISIEEPDLAPGRCWPLSTKALLESLEQLTAEQLRQSVASVLASPPTIASIGRSDNIIRSV